VIDTEQPVEQEITLLSMQQTLLMRVNPYLRENGSNNGVVVTLINITELKQIQNQLRSASLAKSEFLANMSHELRTPLNAILGFTQLMRRNSTLPAKIAENLQTIHRSGEHLLSLINTILDLAKIEAGRMSLEEKPCNLYDLLQGIEEMLRIKAESQGLQFAVEINPEVPQYVVVDVNKLRQLLTNLLGNAFKFTQQGSVLLKVQYVAETPTIQVEVQDTGCGIAAEELERIFEPFVQAKSTAFARQGTGLGLTISRSFVELMGGTLAVNSTLGQGSRFSFSIPVHLASPQDIEPMQSHLQVIGLAPDQPNYKILVVDDQSDNRRLVVQLLSSIGFEVREASDGEQALTLWQEWQPQLILMDILMPGINGYLVTQEIREREAVQGDNSLPRTKIIILTALAMKSDRDRALAVGGDDFLSKPFQESELFDKLAQHLGVRYLYKEPEQARDASQVVSASPAELKSYIAQMPQAWVEQMQEATLLGSENQVMQLIKQIPSDKAVLAQALTLILKRFNYESILTLLDFDA
jgi:signal transduction histidine kinase/CheY-like chemotaxis protein